MSGEIARAVLDGAQVTVTPDCWPVRGKAGKIRVSMTEQTWNGVVTLNRNVPVEQTPEQTEAGIVRAVGEMAEDFGSPYRRKG